MMNLSSVFYLTSILLSPPLNWLSTFLGMMFLPMLHWVMPSRWFLMWSLVTSTLQKKKKKKKKIKHY